jgi:capsular exopolysaccharide synthesis family protein
MEFSSKYPSVEMHESDSNNFLKENIIYYLKKIHWFVLSVIICVFITNIKLKYETPLYQATSKVLFKTTESNELFNEGSAFQDMGFGSNYSPIENEIETLKSRSLMKKVVQDLKLNVVFYLDDGFVLKEQYETPILKVTFLDGDTSIYSKGARFDIKINSQNTFTISNENDNFKVNGSFGSSFPTKIGELIFTPDNNNKKLRIGEKLVLYIYELEDAVNLYAGMINVDKANEYSNVLEIGIVDNSIEKAKDIVNSLIVHHQIEAIKDKNEVAQNSSKFINERINLIADELSHVEGDVQNFKSSNNIVDVGTEVNLFLETQQEIEKSIIENEIQLKLAEYVNSYLKNKVVTTELLPSNLGLNDLSVEHNIELYNNLVLERNRILKSTNEKNPIAVNLESKIINLQENLALSINKYRFNIKIRGDQLSLRSKKMESKISSVPKKEKELREIQRQQEIKESLYLYLLQKREETAITLSLTVANSRVIDEAFSGGNVVSPNRKNYYLIALILGLSIPFVLFFTVKKFNNTIKSSAELERYGLKILSEIPKIANTKNNQLYDPSVNSGFAESFRFLRTKINFLLGVLKSRNKIILITSTLPQEGKSFIAVNLAQSLSLLKKKVILVGLDLRNPTIHRNLAINQSIGVSNYLIDSQLSLNDIIVPLKEEFGFNVLLSGDIPPNPAELLLTKRFSEMMDTLEKQYDYIVIDSAPIGIVADTFLLKNHVDLTLYVLRNNYLDKKFLKFIKKNEQSEDLRNVHYIFNCGEGNSGYGYDDKYSYYYGGKDKKQGFFQRISHFFNQR